MMQASEHLRYRRSEKNLSINHTNNLNKEFLREDYKPIYTDQDIHDINEMLEISERVYRHYTKLLDLD